MAASMDWRKILSGHPILEHLMKYKDGLSTINDCKNWLAVRDGELFVWNPNNASILTTNLKYNTLKNSDGETESSTSPLTPANHKFQTLTLTRLPIEEVDSIVFSPSGNYLAVISRTELIIVQLPRRSGKHGLYKDGQDKILCKSMSVAERLLLSVGLRLIHAEWHPGSVDDSHITLLTSDNYIRTYDIENSTSPVETVCVCSDDGSTLNSSSIATQKALGDTVVDFDFGPVTESIHHRQDFVDGGRKAEKKQLWPIYVLCGNGDVYHILSSLDRKNEKRPSKPLVHGPLTMFPPAEDNYGTDACAIACLPGQPSLLVLVTLDGRIYHCVVLSSEYALKDKCDDEREAETSKVYPAPACSLYVYEEVQLELTLASSSPGPDDSYGENYTCLMRITKDESNPDRYFCTHGAGLHAVKLPWLTKMQNYAKTDDDDDDLPRFSTDCQAVVEHLVCTRPTFDSPDAPPLGTCVLADKLLGTVLLSLTITLEIISLPLRPTSQGPPPALLCDQPPKDIPSPMKQLHKESFDTHIKKILLRETSQPILKTTKTTELGSEMCLQILSQAAKVLREQYIHKLNHAREDIQRRVRILKDQRLQQEDELQRCKNMKQKLIENARRLAETYQRARDQQEDIVHRLETILRKLYARLPLMTDAEKNMKKELRNMEEKIKIYKSNTQQLKMKDEYQTKQIEQTRDTGPMTPRTQFSNSKQHQLRTLLQKEGDSIADLVQQMSKLKTTIEA